jgi:hypothetical protein
LNDSVISSLKAVAAPFPWGTAKAAAAAWGEGSGSRCEGITSRKYELVWGLAERLLDDDVSARTGAVNRSALAGAFARTLRRLEEGAAGGAEWRPTGVVLAARAVRVGVRWLRRPASSLDDEGFGEPRPRSWPPSCCGSGTRWPNAARPATPWRSSAPRRGLGADRQAQL